MNTRTCLSQVRLSAKPKGRRPRRGFLRRGLLAHDAGGRGPTLGRAANADPDPEERANFEAR